MLDLASLALRIHFYKRSRLKQDTFKHAEHTDGDEHNLVERLRKSDAFIPELSLVASADNKIVGHILFTKIKVGKTTQLALAPLTVSQQFQKQGIGSLLVKTGHNIAKTMEFEYSILLGNPKISYSQLTPTTF